MDHILGQQRAISVLQTALNGDRMHHAWVFHGPAGVGKFTTAMALAKLILCHGPQRELTGQLAACGNCAACTRYPDHPDLHVVTKELARYSGDRSIRERKLTSIPVEVLRSSLLEPVYLQSHMQHGKVFIVDQAELLNAAGQNLLLKTLEEPPPQTYLILVTASEDKLLATVRSRCQRVAFVPLDDEVIRQWVDEQNITLTTNLRDWLIGFAAGSLGTAKLAIEYDLPTWAKAVLPAVNAMSDGKYPVNLGAQMKELIDQFAVQWVGKDKNASKDAANKLAAGLMWSMIARHAQKKLHLLAPQCDPADPIGSEAVLEPWVSIIDALNVTQRELASNVNLGLVTDHLVSLMYRAMQGEAVGVMR